MTFQQLNFSDDLDLMIDSMTNSPAKELCLNSKFMYRHHKHNATKLKKSKSAYMFFSMDVRANLKKEGNQLGPNEIMKEISSLWKCLSKKEKVKYEVLAKDDKERYRLEKEELLRTNPSEVAKNRTKNNHIKKPWSAYDFFMNETYPQVKAENPDLYSADILKIVSKKWKALNQNQKMVYQSKAETDKKEKRAQLKAFELKKMLENCQESPITSSEGSKTSKKRVKVDANSYEVTESPASQSTVSGSFEESCETFMSSEPEDTYQLPVLQSFPSRMDSLLEKCLNFSSFTHQISQRFEKQDTQEVKNVEPLELKKLPSVDYSMFAPLRLEDFKFGSFIESFEKPIQTSESKVVNLIDADCRRASFDGLFDLGMSKQVSLYQGNVEKSSGEHSNAFSRHQILNETILNSLY